MHAYHSFPPVTGEVGEDSIPTWLTDEAVRDLDECPSYMGVAPTGAFPLFPDYMREAMTGYEAATAF